MTKLKGSAIYIQAVNVMGENELVVKYEPFKEIIVMEKDYFATPDDIARFASIVAGGKALGLYWAEGVVFLYFPLPASTETTAKLLVERGRVYWTFLGYSFMPKYQAVIETKEKMIVPVVDMASNELIKEVALWLKTQKQA
ncbi:hypothetical protein MUO56_00640 [Candidatus Bathyarchaeota archaeon]|jgi:hypothetical protein|nr:hypothetical protein [Candidatus Bathyarchaeota archaeon]